ncbi:MAG: GNAT family N-acetyltransferase [Dehalococcoidia bacterium]|nr:GNAT family N-acetyltransferase [Dehalococcoidia bacterium]
MRLRTGQFGQAARLLARAFDDEPGALWLLPSDARRRRFLRWAMARDLRYGRAYGHIYTTPVAPEGAAIWLPPEQPRFTVLGLLRAGYLALPLKLGLALPRFLASLGLLDRLHRRDMPGPHWYLAALGVDPPRQGRGLGSALIQPVLRRADAERLPCYLETGREINVTFYGKHGFEVVRTGNAPMGGPRYWTMRREPAA